MHTLDMWRVVDLIHLFVNTMINICMQLQSLKFQHKFKQCEKEFTMEENVKTKNVMCYLVLVTNFSVIMMA